MDARGGKLVFLHPASISCLISPESILSFSKYALNVLINRLQTRIRIFPTFIGKLRSSGKEYTLEYTFLHPALMFEVCWYPPYYRLHSTEGSDFISTSWMIFQWNRHPPLGIPSWRKSQIILTLYIMCNWQPLLNWFNKH